MEEHQLVGMAMSQVVGIRPAKHKLLVEGTYHRFALLWFHAEHIRQTSEIAIAAILDVVAHGDDGVLCQSIRLGYLLAFLQCPLVCLTLEGLVQIYVVYWFEILVHHAAFVFI